METAAAGGIIGLIMGAFSLFIGWYVLILVARWKVFDKAGIGGWKSLIPIYSDYCTYKIAWKTVFFWVLIICGLASGYISNQVTALTENGESIPAMLSMASTVVSLAITVINLLVNVKLSMRFGHGILFGLGLTFLTPLFTLILGLGSSEYLGNPDEGLPPGRRYYR